jgi:hypothetical protein
VLDAMKRILDRGREEAGRPKATPAQNLHPPLRGVPTPDEIKSNVGDEALWKRLFLIVLAV